MRQMLVLDSMLLRQQSSAGLKETQPDYQGYSSPRQEMKHVEWSPHSSNWRLMKCKQAYSAKSSVPACVVVQTKLQVKGLTTSQVIRLIGLLLVFASQKIVHNVRNEMAESIVPLKFTSLSLTFSQVV